MKKRIVSVCMAVVLAGGLFASVPTVQATEPMSPAEMQATITELQAAIAELQATIRVIVQNFSNKAQPVTESVTRSQDRSNRRAERPPRPVNPPITQERAVEIAFAYVGEAGELDEVSLDFEQGQWVWEVEIELNDRREVEMYICVTTGEILSVDWD
jgi:uncharacterized membrane protein YkoI